ncbi:hypothetical protein RB195_014664 [Necator americanus]|uniref:Uncharacterized protein n=1 Tax=Necator americanus TaxID=51031 RepID=A0ABR1E1A9_NECAM
MSWNVGIALKEVNLLFLNLSGVSLQIAGNGKHDTSASSERTGFQRQEIASNSTMSSDFGREGVKAEHLVRNANI